MVSEMKAAGMDGRRLTTAFARGGGPSATDGNFGLSIKCLSNMSRHFPCEHHILFATKGSWPNLGQKYLFSDAHGGILAKLRPDRGLTHRPFSWSKHAPFMPLLRSRHTHTHDKSVIHFPKNICTLASSHQFTQLCFQILRWH